jgi:hypothetical protein
MSDIEESDYRGSISEIYDTCQYGEGIRRELEPKTWETKERAVWPGIS